jgi:uncharacterized membrane protein YqjE
MSGLTDTITMYLEMGLTMAVTAFMVLSVVLFIIDGIKAKRQHRKRKAGITIMFIISIILDVIVVLGMILIGGAIIMYIAGM